ncbi:MAG: DUF3866 family protein [Actinomycetes bacterium]|nr:DUF3866 family protein [Actinomycetes bacterium]
MWGTVVEVVAERKGLQELQVVLDDTAGTGGFVGTPSDRKGRLASATDSNPTYGRKAVPTNASNDKAFSYPFLTGPATVGERVLCNTTAVDLGLGTGGAHFVVARAEAGADDARSGVAFEARNTPADGHVMKLRYSPLQVNVPSVEAPESSYHELMERCDSLDDTPVVCCGLHSQVPLVAAAVKKAAPHLRVGYVMSDQAALALSLSKVIADARAAELLDCTVTTGQAFGGELEAINLHSGLLAAAHIGGCDVLIAAIGPGLAGTGTPFGHGGVAQGEAINAAAVLGGHPVVCLRLSQADTRARHQGISHHSSTALEKIALTAALIALPAIPDEQWRVRIDEQLAGIDNRCGHEAFQLEEPFYDEASLRGVSVTTMGRSYADDPLFFEAAFAAGAVAAALAVKEEVDVNALPPCVSQFNILDTP